MIRFYAQCHFTTQKSLSDNFICLFYSGSVGLHLKSSLAYMEQGVRSALSHRKFYGSTVTYDDVGSIVGKSGLSDETRGKQSERI